MIDIIIEQGPKKCLLILGLSYEKWWGKIRGNEKNLEHQDLEVLGLEVVDKTQGQIIESLIDNLANKVGKPLQIISDHGSDIKKGIELYVAKNPQITYKR